MRALGAKLPFRFQTCIDCDTHSEGINLAQLGSLFCVILTNELFKKIALIKGTEPIGRNFKQRQFPYRLTLLWFLFALYILTTVLIDPWEAEPKSSFLNKWAISFLANISSVKMRKSTNKKVENDENWYCDKIWCKGRSTFRSGAKHIYNTQTFHSWPYYTLKIRTTT